MQHSSRNLLRVTLRWASKNMSCEDRLKRCGLTTLDMGRSRQDMYDPKVEKYHWERSSIYSARGSLNEHQTRQHFIVQELQAY